MPRTRSVVDEDTEVRTNERTRANERPEPRVLKDDRRQNPPAADTRPENERPQRRYYDDPEYFDKPRPASQSPSPGQAAAMPLLTKEEAIATAEQLRRDQGRERLLRYLRGDEVRDDEATNVRQPRRDRAIGDSRA